MALTFDVDAAAIAPRKYKVLYVRFPESFKGGVQSYSENFIQIVKKYGADNVEIIDMYPLLLEFTSASPKLRFRRRTFLQWLEHGGYLVGLDAAVADVGLLEHREFFFIKFLKQAMPSISTYVTIHDAPASVVNLFPAFEPWQGYRVVRGLRKLVNIVLGHKVEQSFFSQGHTLITLTQRARIALRAKLTVLDCSKTQIEVFRHPLMADGVIRRADTRTGRRINVGYLGYISHAKGIDLLIQAIDAINSRSPQAIANVTFHIAGGVITDTDQAYLDSLRAFASQRGLDSCVKFLGFVDSSALPGYLTGLDLIVLPYRETGSGAASGPLMWARTFGVPVLASNARNFSDEIVHGTDGLLFDNSLDGRSLTDELYRYLSDPTLRQTLLGGAAGSSDDCSWNNSARKFVGLLQLGT